MAAVSFPKKTKTLSINENGITINNKTFMKKEIYTLDYNEPKGIFWAIFSSNPLAIIFIVWIPFFIYFVKTFMNFWVFKITLKNEFDDKGERKTVSFYLTNEQVNQIKEKY